MRTYGRLPGEGSVHAHIGDQHRGAQLDAARDEGRTPASWWGDTTPRCGSCQATAGSCRATYSRDGVQCCDDCRADRESGVAKYLHATPRGSAARAALYARAGVPDPLETAGG